MHDSYKSGPFKNRMSSSSGDLFWSVLSCDKGLFQPQLTSTPTNLISANSNVPSPSYFSHEGLVCSSATFVKFLLKTCGKWWRVCLSRALSTCYQRSSNASWSTSHTTDANGPWHIKFKVALIVGLYDSMVVTLGYIRNSLCFL